MTALIGRNSRRLLQNSLTCRVGVGGSILPSAYSGNYAFAAATRKATTSTVAPILSTQAQNNESKGYPYPLEWMKAVAGMTAAGVLLSSGIINNNVENNTDCCGIVGVVGTEENDAR